MARAARCGVGKRSTAPRIPPGAMSVNGGLWVWAASVDEACPGRVVQRRGDRALPPGTILVPAFHTRTRALVVRPWLVRVRFTDPTLRAGTRRHTDDSEAACCRPNRFRSLSVFERPTRSTHELIPAFAVSAGPASNGLAIFERAITRRADHHRCRLRITGELGLGLLHAVVITAATERPSVGNLTNSNFYTSLIQTGISHTGGRLLEPELRGEMIQLRRCEEEICGV